jgi:hypothetical protein
MARRSFGVAAKMLLLRHDLDATFSTLPFTRNAPECSDARMHRLIARRRAGCFLDWLNVKSVYRHTTLF